jgi:hypothetical protein
MQNVGPSGKPFDPLPEQFRGLRPKHAIFKHARDNTASRVTMTRFDNLTKLVAMAVSVPAMSLAIYPAMLFLAGEFTWAHGNVVYLQLELKHAKHLGRPAFNIIMHIFNEQEAREKAGRTDDGVFYRTSRQDWQSRRVGDWASFPTRKHAIAIQKAYRGKLARRKADRLREEYYRPGGRGYLAARNRFYAGAAVMAANQAAANMV